MLWWKFRNYDTETIRHLLEEIGRYRFNSALEQMQIHTRPTKMSKFYLEANKDCIYLYYKFPDGDRGIMKVERYHNIPTHGWEYIWGE